MQPQLGDTTIYATIGGGTTPRRYLSLKALEAAAAGKQVTAIQYTQITARTGEIVTYLFDRYDCRLVASGSRGYDGEGTAVPQPLLDAVTPLAFTGGLGIPGLMVELGPDGAMAIRAYGVSDPLAAVKAVLKAMDELNP